MKCAIFHNYFDNVGGGEKLVVAMARLFKADIITTDVNPAVVRALGAQDIHFISLGKTIKIPGLKQVSASLYFSRADVAKDYDQFILSGEWAVFAAKKHHPNVLYCHTPARVFFDLYERFLRRQSFWKKPLFLGWVMMHRWVLQRAWNNIDRVVCNSKTTQKRIRKFHKREARVVYPFAAVPRRKKTVVGNFWLSVNRLYPEKRIELQLDALRRLPAERLVIVGGVGMGDHAGEYARQLMRNLPKNVEMRSNVAEGELARLYQGCRGLVATAYDEDFGLAVVEAFAYGKPVVAVDEGGYRETMVQGRTGLLVDADPAQIGRAMQQITENPQKFRSACRRRAQGFSKERFYAAIKREVQPKRL